MKKFFSIFAAALLSVSMFAAREVVPSVSDFTVDPSTNVIFCVYFDGEVCNDLYAVGTFNGWSTELGESTTLLKVRPVTGFDGWYVVSFPYAAETKGKICQLTSEGTWSWGTQAQEWEQAGTMNKTLAEPDGDGNCVFPEAGLYTYYSKSFQGNPCQTATFVIKVYAPECEYVEPTIAGDFNNWGNDSDADTDMDVDFDEEGVMFYYKEIVNGIGGYKLRGGYGWGNNIEGYDAENDGWNNMFPNNVPLSDTTYYFNDPELFRYQTCEEPVECDSVEYTFTATFIPCEGATPAITGTFNGWDEHGILMTATATPGVYTVTVKATCKDLYKFTDNVLGWDGQPAGQPSSNYKFGEEAEINADLSAEEHVWGACAEPEAINNVFENARIEKVIENGQLIIKVDGVRYTTTGARL